MAEDTPHIVPEDTEHLNCQADASSEAGSDGRSDSGSDEVSESSTIVYEHESFETFQHRVKRFCSTQWPNATEDCFEISRLDGGAFNRVIGIKYTNPVTEQSEEYVLRIPRFESAPLEYEVADFVFAAKSTGLPVPEVIAYDLTENNSLKTRYSIQRRIPGQSLYEVYPTLNPSQKTSVAKAMAQVITKLQSKVYSRFGRIDPTPVLAGTESDLKKVFRFEVPARQSWNAGVDERIPSAPQAVFELLLDLFERWKAYDISICPVDDCERLNKLIDMTKQMEELGMFKDQPVAFCHLDLEPRNILVTVLNDTEVVIEGILDWDSAVFAPRFMACKVPFWLWRWDDEDDDTDERNANKPFIDELDLEIKRTFEGAIGQRFLYLAYPRKFQIARKLFILATEGMRSTGALNEADELIEEWSELHIELLNPVKEMLISKDGFPSLGAFLKRKRQILLQEITRCSIM
ncbi:hypothetical protein NA57DRAFT_48185 [Rhizodiscina lignyota]|uniref:Aminoglycoside phosphotransferase domain-containing protein n=1 Tax=Rhizodiscina lignyota TaxID=1504668 RepID=A0A9P4I820_9PEZI|nr:hypothetical protein NA57DRAFT_48185 [Rhizodiscina lignyota]